MSSAGMPTGMGAILPMVAPDLYEQELRNARRRAMAEMLLEKGQSESNAPYTGVRNFGNSIAGAYLLRRSDEQELENARAMSQLFMGSGQGGQAPSQDAPPQLTGGMSGIADRLNASGGGQPIQGSSLPAVPPQMGGGTPPAQGGGILNGTPFIPDLPGMDPRQKVLRYLQDPAAYMKAYYDSLAATPDMKNIAAAYGANSPEYQAALRAKITSDRIVNLRQGSTGFDPMTGGSISVPNSSGIVSVPLPGGGFGQTMAPGAAAAQAQSAAAGAIGTNVGKPAGVYNPSAPPGGQFPTVNANTAAGVPPQTIQGLGLPLPTGASPSTPPSPAAGGAQPPASTPPGFQSQPPLGASAGADIISKQLAQTQADSRAMASDAPTRINVLRSILGLVNSGAPTGSPEWIQAARAAASGLKVATGRDVPADDPAALMGEIQKYMSQYALRMAKGQGGTGTDMQLQAIIAANPHDEMFPNTLRRVVPWIMANEYGIEAKANAMDQMIGPTPDPGQQTNFERFWRNTYTPQIAQFEMMTPKQKEGYLKDRRVFPDQAAIMAFYNREKALRGYFQMVPR